MTKPRQSLAWPITLGVILILSALALGALYNIVIVADHFRLKELAVNPPDTGRWMVLSIGSVLFLLIIVGMILFMISLVKEIRTNQAQQNFIDSVTHELKTPLTSLKLYLQTLERKKLTPEQQHSFHQVMLGDVERLNLLVDHILDTARMEQRTLSLEPRPLELMPIVHEAVRIVRDRHGLDPDAIRIEGIPNRVLADGIGLEMVLTNLLDNAIKYSGDRVEVIVTVGKGTISVSDRGVGIPKAQLKRIFQRFYRIGNELTRSRKGTGLGLYLVKETLKKMGGRIRAESAGENQGSTFLISLPGAP